ncbi:hypothetical protein L9F63_020445, partial [Diploptera punctata]
PRTNYNFKSMEEQLKNKKTTCLTTFIKRILWTDELDRFHVIPRRLFPILAVDAVVTVGRLGGLSNHIFEHSVFDDSSLKLLTSNE